MLCPSCRWHLLYYSYTKNVYMSASFMLNMVSTTTAAFHYSRMKTLLYNLFQIVNFCSRILHSIQMSILKIYIYIFNHIIWFDVFSIHVNNHKLLCKFVLHIFIFHTNQRRGPTMKSDYFSVVPLSICSSQKLCVYFKVIWNSS